MKIVSIRGATTVTENISKEIISATRELLSKIMSNNDIIIENVISIFFTATKDITSTYPAVAARELGFTQCGILCLHEMEVEDSLTKCIRVLVLYNSSSSQSKVKHVYLREARNLRPDLISS